MSYSKYLLLIGLTLLLGAILRFWQLGTFPSGLTQDEVAIGYNAYSILQTGRDEWGTFLPSSFRSVGDYKMPVAIYSTVPFIYFLGLNEWSVRLPVAIFSFCTLIAFYILCRRFIFKKQIFAILATLLMSISPWHIFYSRSGFEAVIALFFAILNIYFLLNLAKFKKISSFYFVIIFAIMAMVSYHSYKLFIPTINLTFLLICYKQYKIFFFKYFSKKPIFLLSHLLVLFILASVFTKIYLIGQASIRAKMTFLKNDYEYARIITYYIQNLSFFSFHKNILLVLFWFKRLLIYFSPSFYISSGLGFAPLNKLSQGVIYFIEFPLLVTGTLFLFFFQKKLLLKPKIAQILLMWVVLSFLPASLTNNTQHSLRSLSANPAIIIIITVGIIYLFQYLKPIKTWILILIILYVFSILKFADRYLIHYPQQMAESRHYGFKEMAIFANSVASEYDSIYIDPRFGVVGPNNLGVPYLYFLFYSAYPPNLYQQDVRRSKGNSDYENFYFQEINWPNYNHSQNDLFIGSPWSFPLNNIESERIRFKVFYPNGDLALMAVSNL